MFRTDLAARHIDGKYWKLTEPLVFEGRHEVLVVCADFDTDFASIPKSLRWLMDNAGANSEAAVLHDALYRESKLPNRRIDPADADGLFRRALRLTGSTALTRGFMWGAVRFKSIKAGRYGSAGPSAPIKIAQVVGIFLLAVAIVVPPTIVALAGLAFYWLVNWIVTLGWQAFERRHFDPEKEPDLPNLPWHPGQAKLASPQYDPSHLVVLARNERPAVNLLLAIDEGRRVRTEHVNTAAIDEASRLQRSI